MNARTIGMATAAVLFASMAGFGTLLPPLQAQTASAGNPEATASPSNRTAKEEPTGSIGVVFATPTAASSVGELVVKSAVDDGPAAIAGIKSGDEILTLDGNAVTSVAQLTDFLSKHSVGTSVKVEYLRAGRRLQCVLVVVERKQLYRNWYAKRAERGEPEGEYSLGMTYYLGYGTPKDYKQSAQWFTKAAEQGNAPAQYGLASLYYEGYGVERDYAVAMQWFRKSAEQGYAPAQFFVGMMFENGRAGATNLGEAMAWYQKAAQQDFGPAQFFIGNLYAQGRGVQKDLQQARFWYSKAIQAGNSDAKNALAALDVAENSGKAVAEERVSPQQSAAMMPKAGVQGTVPNAAPSLDRGRLTKEQIKSILADAHAEQTNTALSADLILDSRGLAAALTTFQKNFGGMSGFLRNPQLKQPPVSHTISDLQKRLGKDMAAKEPADVVAMAEAASNCVDYLSSPGLVSYMEPDVARVTRQSADSALQKMNEVSTSITGANLRSLFGKTKEHLDEAAELEANRGQIAAEMTAIQGIESALDQGNTGPAIDGWKRLSGGQYPMFSFTKKYIDSNAALMADVALFDSCRSKLTSVTAPDIQQVHVRQLLIVYECEDVAKEKPDTQAFLKNVESEMHQNLAKDFGTVPTRNDLATWIQVNQRFSAYNANSSPKQMFVAIQETQTLQKTYAALPATSALLSSRLAQQVEALEKLIASKRACSVGAYQAPAVLAKTRDGLSAQLGKLRQEAPSLAQVLHECEVLSLDDASARPVINLLHPATQGKIRRDAEQLQAGNRTLQAINSAIANVEGEIQKLDQEAREADARRQARADALQEAQERREAERQEALEAVLAATRAKCCGLVKVIGADRMTNANSVYNVVTLIANVSGKNYKMSALCPIGVRDCRPLVENNIYMFEALPKGNPDGYNLDNDMGSIRIFNVDASGQRHGATVYAVATVN